MEPSKKTSILHKDGVSFVLPFILITSCFALWGFANDITNPMVKAFSKIFRMSVTDGALVQVAFYGGYFAMAFPAAIFIRRYSYKAGILLGLGLYAVGAFLFFPAKVLGEYAYFLLAYFILTCGLSFLETSANPYILSMGTEETATRRLNLAQSFNPMGSLLGMYVAMNFIQARLNPMDSDARAQLNDAEFEALKEADLSVLITPYVAIAAVILLMFLIIRFTKMPKNGDKFFIDTWISNVYLYFTDRNYRITDSEGKAIGYAKAVWAMIDQADRKPKDLHELHGTTIDQYIDEETECPIAKASRVKPLAEDTYTKSIDTEYSDIDLNGHVNSIKYIEHILNLFNLEHYKQMSVKRFEIAYMAESYYGDVLRLYLRDNANGTFDAEAQKDSHDDAKNTVLVRCNIKFE